jgi:Asp/Glu/hydantoin racemase
MSVRIVLIHATAVSMPPIRHAFEALWPEAEPVNLLEDALSRDLEKAGGQTPEIVDRIVELARYAVRVNAAGILFTCSAFGRAIAKVKAEFEIPVLKPNEAMFEDALAAGSRLGLLVTFAPSVKALEEELTDLAKKRRKGIRLETVLVEGAMSALAAGDVDTHNRLLARAAANLSGCDAVMLGQFSTSLALEEVRRKVSCQVLASPSSAVLKLKSMLA